MSHIQDLCRFDGHPMLAGWEFHAELPSTNDRALELLANGDVPLPYLILAEQQTAGRGRGANVWWAQKGALTFSLLIDRRKFAVPPERLPLLSLLTAIAVADVIDQTARETSAQLKWPNDVFIDSRKVCGILVEVPPPNKILVIGVGLNVNNSFAGANEERGMCACALCDVVGRELSVSNVLRGLLSALERRLEMLSATMFDLQAEWQPRCRLRGRWVEVTAGSHVMAGQCRGIDPSGALLLENEQGIQRCIGGTVTRVVPS